MKTLRRSVSLLGLVAVSFVGACSPDASPGEDDQAIIVATNSDESQNSVVRLTSREDNGVYSCTGSLLAPNLVLTARHCVAMTTGQNIGCTSDGTGDAGGAVGADFDATTLFVSYGPT